MSENPTIVAVNGSPHAGAGNTSMKHDYKHWQENGLYDGFENYIQQTATKPKYNPAVNDAWIKELIAQHRKKKKGNKKRILKKKNVTIENLV